MQRTLKRELKELETVKKEGMPVYYVVNFFIFACWKPGFIIG